MYRVGPKAQFVPEENIRGFTLVPNSLASAPATSPASCCPTWAPTSSPSGVRCQGGMPARPCESGSSGLSVRADSTGRHHLEAWRCSISRPCMQRSRSGQLLSLRAIVKVSRGSTGGGMRSGPAAAGPLRDDFGRKASYCCVRYICRRFSLSTLACIWLSSINRKRSVNPVLAPPGKGV